MEGGEILTIGTRVWAEWFKDIFYKGTVSEIHEEQQVIKVLFDDDDEKYLKNDMLQVVIDKEISENELQSLREGDVMLAKIRNSTAMAKGTLKNIGNIFLTICLADNTIVRRRSTSLRMLRPFKVPDLTTKVPNLTTTQTLICADLSNSDIEVNVKEKQKLDDSVVVVRTVPLTKLSKADPFGSAPTIENPKILSPEVLWGQENLIELQSPVVSELNGENNSEVSLGLSLDPLNSTRYCQSLISPNLPIHSSTPYLINEPEDFSLDVNTFEF